jgi:hypothetical protein
VATWTLSDIRNKVRKITGRLTPGELSNAELDTYINNYYQLVLPAELKLEKKHTYYEFLTEENTAFYNIPHTTYTNFEPPATMDNLSMLWYQDPAAFFENNPEQVVRATPWTGDGSTLNFSMTAQGFPIMPASLVVTDETELFQDTSQTWTTANVTLTGSLGGTGTVNYDTGVIDITFNTAPANGQLISISYVQFNPGRPTAVLMYNDQFQFFPAPNTAYRFKIKAYELLSELTLATSTPELNQWGPLIAHGAAGYIFTDLGETDSFAENDMYYKRELRLVLNKTLQNLLNTRAAPNF